MNNQRQPGPVTEPTSPINEDEPECIAPNPDPFDIPTVDPPPASPWFSVFWLLLALVAIWGIVSATLNMVELWQRQLWLAVPMLLGTVVLVFLFGRAMWQEFQAMRDVDALSTRRDSLDAAVECQDISGLKSTLEPTLENLETRRPALIDEFRRAVVDEEDCRDYLRTFENIVLYSLDQEADEVVRHGSVATAAAVAIVPHPAFDAAVVLWRTLVMTRRIGAIYGLRPGGLSSWRLFSHSLKSALLAAGMDTLTTVMTDASADAVARALKPLAEGIVIGVRVHRFGRLTIGICRPVTCVAK